MVRRKRGKLRIPSPEPEGKHGLRVDAIKSFFGRLGRAAKTDVLGRYSTSRRRLLTRAASLAAVATLGSATWWTRGRAMPSHELTLGLSSHWNESDAKHFERVILAAKAAGQPFHAIGHEASQGNSEEVEDFVRDKKQVNELINGYYTKLLASGLSRRPALEQVRKNWVEILRKQNELFPEFLGSIYTIAFKHNLAIVPVEWYSEREIELLEEDRQGHLRKILREGLKLPTLSEQLEVIAEGERLGARNILKRNQRIIENMPRVIELLKKHHPRLVGKRPLRVLYVMGLSHSGVIEAKTPTEIETTFSLNPLYLVGAPKDIVYKLSRNPRAPLSQTEKARLVLSYNLLPKILEFEEQGRMEEVASLNRALKSLTLTDFQELDRLTANEPLEQKAEIIYEYFKKK